MSKELEALNDLRNSGLVKDDVVCFTKKAFEKRLDIIETTFEYHELLEKSYKEWCSMLKKYGIYSLESCENKLKALKVIKEVIPIEEEDFFYDKETDTYFFVGGKVSKDQYDLLKEVLF